MGGSTGVVARARSDRTFSLRGIIERFSLSRGIQLIKLTPQGFAALGRSLDKNLEFELGNCIMFSENYSNGLVICSKTDDPSLIYLGYHKGETSFDGEGTTFTMLERAIIESSDLKMRIGATPCCITFEIRDKFLGRVLTRKECGIPAQEREIYKEGVKVYEGEMSAGSRNVGYLRNILNQLF